MMFAGCDRLQNVDLSKFDTSKVTNMHGMFLECQSLYGVEFNNDEELTNLINTGKAKGIDISNFNTSNVTDMSAMFQYSVVPRIRNGTFKFHHT